MTKHIATFSYAAVMLWVLGSTSGGQAATIQLTPQPTQPQWVKVCSPDAMNRNCYVTRDFATQDGRPVLAIAVHEQRGATTKYMVRTLLPLGLRITDGVRIAIDNNPAQTGAYVACLQTGCFAETPIQADVIQQLRRGKLITVAAKNQYGHETSFQLPADGFSKAYDSPAIDYDALAEQQENMRTKLMSRTAPTHR